MKSVIVLASFMLVAAASADPAPGDSGKARAKYILHCSGCHGLNGEGTIEGGIPGFPKSVRYIADLEQGRDYILHVPGVVSTNMPDADVAEVLNYILDRWGGDEDPAYFSAEEVTRRRSKPDRDIVMFRREITRNLRASGVEISDYPWP